MTTENNTIMDPFLGEVLTAMATQSENTTNRVMDNYEGVITDWKAAYAKLWDAVSRANMKIDSVTLGEMLWNTVYTRDQAAEENVWTRP